MKKGDAEHTQALPGELVQVSLPICVVGAAVAQ